VLVHRRVPADSTTATVTIKLDNAFRLLMLAMGDFSSPGVEIAGDQTALQQFLGVLDRPEPSFNIITP
jgi:alkyl sulfatase BDS1-like metallo-beta-lactamase superfamily hydrolase